jgi:Apea-like HEPN
MARVAFTDYSGLRDFGREEVACRTKFFIYTTAFLSENQHAFDYGFMWNGTAAEVRFDFTQKDRVWATTLDVNLSGFMREPNSGLAEYLINQSLDVLSLRSASPYQCVIQNAHDELPFESGEAHAAGAIITMDDIDQAARMGMLLYTFEDTLLKALSWYRRGISTVDPALGFLALWNSLETVAAKFHVRSDEIRGRSKKQILRLLTDHLSKSGFQFFKPQTDEMSNWIEISYDKRKDLAHGLRALGPSTNRELRDAIPRLKSIVTAILRVMLDLRCKENDMIVKVFDQADLLKKQQVKTDNEITDSSGDKTVLALD